MNPENQNQITSQSTSTSSQSVASSGEISDQEKMERILKVAGFLKSGWEYFFQSPSKENPLEKGKGKEIVDELDLMIKNAEQSGIVANQNYEGVSFNQDIRETMGEKWKKETIKEAKKAWEKEHSVAANFFNVPQSYIDEYVGLSKHIGQWEATWIVPKVLEKHTIELRNQIKNNAKTHARQLTGLRDHIIDTETKHQNELADKDTEIKDKSNKIQELEGENSKIVESGTKKLKEKENEKQALETKIVEKAKEINEKINEINKVEKEKETLTQEKNELEKQINELKSEKQVITNNYNQVAKKCLEYERIAAETAEQISNQTLLPDPPRI